MATTTPCKVYWLGRHASTPQLGAPVSKVHKAGLQMLQSLGWTEVANTTTEVPVFALTTRKGANYPADQPGLPPVRQLPQRNTACLDDKRLMQQHMRAGGLQARLLVPPCWDTLADCMHWLQQQQQQGASGHDAAEGRSNADGIMQPTTGAAAVVPANAPLALPARTQHGSVATPHRQDQMNSMAASATQPQAQQCHHDQQPRQAPQTCPVNNRQRPHGLLFVKHRRGVKGQAVYVVPASLAKLQELQQRLQHSAGDFMVQQEVAPPMLLHGRKFVLRLHVLVVLQRPHTQLEVCVHSDVIVLQHAAVYDAGSTSDPAVHVSSKGKRHPAPLLLHELPELHTKVWPQLQEIAAAAISAVKHELVPPIVHPGCAVLYHLFGFDCVVEASGRAVLLEVNSYPAIASGTMAAVDLGVFTRLLRDLVTLCVLPHTNGAAPDPGGWCCVDDGAVHTQHH